MRNVVVVFVSVLVSAVAVAQQAGRQSLVVDVDCDGKADRVSVSQDKHSALVKVMFGDTKRKPAVFRFRADPGSQNAACAMPVHLEAESLDYDPHEDSGDLPGFRRSKTCKAFSLVDDECDSIHFYWNHDAQQLVWWRR